MLLYFDWFEILLHCINNILGMRKIWMFLILLSSAVFSQNNGEKIIKGTITNNGVPLEGVNVVNLVSEKSTVSDANGVFFISVKPEDLLVFSAVNLDYMRKSIEIDDYIHGVINVGMTYKTTILKEVVVSELSGSNKGVSVFSGVKKYTPAQRRLYTARSGIFDAVINKFSGRTAMLKKELKVEAKERLMDRVVFLYDDDFYVNKLKIPQDYIKGFQYYIIEDDQFVAALNAKNKTLMLFAISRLANSYLDIICIKN